MNDDIQWHRHPYEEAYRQASSNENFQTYWLRYFTPGNETLLRALTPPPRRESQEKMITDCDADFASMLRDEQ